MTNNSLTLPGFTITGALPTGEHLTDWLNFYKRFGFNSHRRRYLRCFELFTEDFKSRGGTEILIGGSFVTCKTLPSDIDFTIDRRELEHREMKGLKIPTLEVRRKQIAPLHFIPDISITPDISEPSDPSDPSVYVTMGEEPFSAREFLKNKQRIGLEDSSVGIVVLMLNAA
ncbi:MAG: hypothetical protein Q8T09_11470 [Candidatus Melainabacteria bacterium]|nr:hypothetical protein [Candidatus Melainabacteria bacterium]